MTESGRETPESRTLTRIGLLMAFAALLLGWLAVHTDVLFADGLRYLAQARLYSQKSGNQGLKSAVDHPIYPLAIAGVHKIVGGDRPEDWQAAAQIVAVLAGVLLVAPLYMVSRELFGDACAVPACLLFYLVPLTGHVFADTLSESTFLLFWTCGLWAALRFLKGGTLAWIPAIVGFSALAYLTRPEGLLLPAALLSAIGLSPIWVAKGLGKRGMIALAVLVVGSAGLVGPYVALKGGLGTKPSIQRLLGTAPKSAAHAVERQRPLDPDQPESVTYLLAGKAVFKAITAAITWPLVPFAAMGLIGIGLRPGADVTRQKKLLAVIGVASILALVRLHATGGYCSPRHAMILSLILIPAAASGLHFMIGLAGRGVETRKIVGWVLALGVLTAVNADELLAPVNSGLDVYKQAGHWLAGHAAADSHIVDVTGWAQFYGQRDGYTFENLVAAPADPSARWVVASEAHLKGPWEYCQRLRALTEGLEPVETFKGSAGRRRPTRVYVYDRQPILARPATSAPLRR